MGQAGRTFPLPRQRALFLSSLRRVLSVPAHLRKKTLAFIFQTSVRIIRGSRSGRDAVQHRLFATELNFRRRCDRGKTRSLLGPANTAGSSLSTIRMFLSWADLFDVAWGEDDIKILLDVVVETERLSRVIVAIHAYTHCMYQLRDFLLCRFPDCTSIHWSTTTTQMLRRT
jgi:hypothetical protein